MIIPVCLFVGPSRLVSMLEVGKHDDLETIAQNHANQFPDVIYFLTEMVIENDDADPDLEIKWKEWYGKQVTANVHVAVSVGAFDDASAEPLHLMESELFWFVEKHPYANVFVYNS